MVGDFTSRAAFRAFDVPEELESVELDERIHDIRVNAVAETRLDRSGPGLCGLGGAGVLQHVVVPRSSSVAAEQRVAHRARGRVLRARETKAEVIAEFLVVADLCKVAG